MKLFAIAAGMIAMSSVASANVFAPTFPDFEMEKNYEKSVIAKNVTVKSYVKALGASSFKVTNGKPALRVYAVETNNGCAFDVEVVYNDWPGVDAVVVYKNAVCR
jgi:hypothetical protein